MKRLKKVTIGSFLISNMRKHAWLKSSFIAAVLVSMVGSFPAFAGPGDGPRSFPLLPKDLNLFTVYAMSQKGNQLLDPGQTIPDAEFDVAIGILQYTRTFSVNDNLAAAFVAVPFANIRGEVPLGAPTGTVSAKDSGLGGIIIGGVIGLVGSPALSAQEFASYDPGLQIGLVGKLILPTGSYDPSRVISVGSNRLAAQLVLPITYNLGSSMGDPNLTTFEVLPSITVFGDNTDPSGGATVTGQKPLYSLESHVTRNLGGSTWVSFGGIYNSGGETSTNNLWADDARESFALGASISFAVNKSTAVKVSYGETVWRNDNGMDGKLLRVVTTFVF